MSEEQAVPTTPAGPKLGVFHTSLNPEAILGPRVGSNVDVIRSAEGAAPASRNDPQRDVFIACSPMDINKHIFGRLTDGVAKLVTWFGGVPRPNVLFHWGVIVGDYVHELNYDAHYYNMYENKQAEVVNPESKLHRGAYRLYKVGTTRFNDAAIVEEGVKAIAEPYMTPVYHVRTNNCHKFVIELLNLICDANRKRVMTTFGFLCSGEMVGGESDMETMLNTVQYLMDQSEAEKKIPEPPQVTAIDSNGFNADGDQV